MVEIRSVAALVVLALGQYSWGHTNRVSDNCKPFNPGPIISKCRGRAMPPDRIRNFAHSSHQLACSANSDNFIRRPQDFNFDEWQQWVQASAEKAQEYRLKNQPLIQWQGRIPYQTIEIWKWQSCYEGTSSFECGSHSHTRTRWQTVCSGSGEDRKCSEEPYEETYYEANTCRYEHDMWEAVHCSNEKIEYQAEFLRDPSWKPGAAVKNPTMQNGIQAYHDSVPAKYDLLRGESELLQVFNTGERSTAMTPVLKVGDAWNEYQPAFKLSTGGSSFLCHHDTNYSMTMTVSTLHRIANKASANAFKLPETWDGKPLPPLGWQNNEVGSKPTVLTIMDSSAAMVQLMAEQSRRMAERQVAMLDAGEGTNPDGLNESEQAKKKGFYKNTLIRAQIYKVNRFWWDTQAAFDLISNDSTSIQPSNLFLSSKEEVKWSEIWNVGLEQMYQRDGHRFRQMLAYPDSIFNGDSVHLRPGRSYVLKVSMYQKGVPFYLQSCEDDPHPDWHCNAVIKHTWLGRDEYDYFSKPILIPFSTRNDVDSRNLWQKFWEGINVFEYAGYKRPDPADNSKYESATPRAKSEQQ